MEINLDRWRNKIAVVTGASSGIGAAISVQLANLGIKVVGIARRKEKIELLSKSTSQPIIALSADVSKESEVVAAFKWIKETVGPVQILVNSAGITRITNLIDGNVEMWKDTLSVNVIGLCIVTREAVKQMLQNKLEGHIIHMNSLSGHGVPNTPNVNVYPASKHAVTALGKTLRHELKVAEKIIKITDISPGLVETEFFEVTALASGRDKISEGDAKFLNTVPILQVKDVVNAVVYVLSTPPHVQINELIMRPIGVNPRKTVPKEGLFS